ncbi:equilibrative nucleotide transporter 3 [Phtheirospermum japonicum]|uniref:Equilibrative nucleotide transporter 3 n=1 Tax=Phtheirospermum japonicum TaxID=374723 RepID=A0A830B6Y1_9LAMI|nr:equilibrative nucleotide transporter 3 [Phtheirospermum japonicum]
MVVCWFLGIGVLLPWNSIVTIGDYYYQLFPHYHPGRVLALIPQPFSLGTSAILSYHVSKINTRKRTLFGYVLFSFSIFGILLIDLATSGKGGLPTYIAICVLVASFGVESALVEGGVLGELSFMCPEFIQSFIAGLAASGALTSCLRLLTKALFDNTNHGLRKGVMLYMGISTFVEFMCIFMYAYIFAKIPIVKHFRKKAALDRSRALAANVVVDVQINNEMLSFYYLQVDERQSNKELVLQNIDYTSGVFLIYALTFSIFPGFLYENTGTHKLGSWYAIVLIAAYNVWDMIARFIPLVERIKLESRRGLLIASLLRLLFVPSFYFTSKYQVDQGWMIMLVSFLGLTNGYLTVCIFTVAPRGYMAAEQNALGNLLVLFILIGLFSGACLDLLWTL